MPSNQKKKQRATSDFAFVIKECVNTVSKLVNQHINPKNNVPLQ